MNIGVREALKLDDFGCFIFHDVDLIPENDFNIYECYSQPRHLSPAVDELRYKYKKDHISIEIQWSEDSLFFKLIFKSLMYYNLVGGVLALNREQLNRTNGFSNLYWGWGKFSDLKLKKKQHNF
jgi:hypothetical protein